GLAVGLRPCRRACVRAGESPAQPKGKALLPLLLLLFAVSLPAATNPQAAAEANAGLSLARQGKYELAITPYQSRPKRDPKLPGLSLNLGVEYSKLNLSGAAIQSFEQAAQADPAGFQVRVLLGMSYFATRQFAEAATELGKATQQQPDNTELRFKLAQSLL